MEKHMTYLKTDKRNCPNVNQSMILKSNHRSTIRAAMLFLISLIFQNGDALLEQIL